MSSLAKQRCLVHVEREAVARCLDCTNYFCRECIGEHEGKMICAGCLRKQTNNTKEKPRRPTVFVPSLLLIVSLLFLWSMFYGIGNLIIRLPHSFHDGTMWKQKWLDEGWEENE